MICSVSDEILSSPDAAGIYKSSRRAMSVLLFTHAVCWGMALFYLQIRKGTANITQDLHAMVNWLYQNPHSTTVWVLIKKANKSARENYEEK